MDLPLIVYLIGGGAALALLLVLWQVFGRGPRRRRGLKRARRRLAEGAWQDALERVRKLRNLGAPSAAWLRRFNEAEAECLQAGGQGFLAQKKFEEALTHLVRAAQALGEPEVTAKITVQAAMLEEVRRLFAQGTLGDSRPVHDLLARVLLVQSPNREAFFWQGLAFLRDGEPQKALDALQSARSGEARVLVLDEGLGDMSNVSAGANPAARGAPASSVIDPPLYLGAILLRQGQAKESLRFLTEANRTDAGCPIVTLQLGAAMIAAGGDTQLAVRALQRALGPKGLQQWEDNPGRAWVEGMPTGRSYIRKLAERYPYTCPLWGPDLKPLIQQGHLALGQGLYKMGAYQEAADLLQRALQQGAPSLAVLRGLGLALARVGKYDDAFKHLRIAHEMEEPKDRVTAGYLALCGAMGKPAQPEDKPRNLAWAIGVVTQFNAPGDAEWVALISALFTEAREENVPLGLDEQLYLCEHLVSVSAADPQAAQAYHHLQATFPHAVASEYAWLYSRSAQQHGVQGEHALPLFARTFAEEPAARDYFAGRGWSFDDVINAYLERAATLDPGHFPAVLGPEFPARGEAMLLSRSEAAEAAGDLDAAAVPAEILLKLAPDSPRALDRLAYLQHKRQRDDEALRLLTTWNERHPADPLPLVRLAVLHHRQGNIHAARSMIERASQITSGPTRGRIALLGARLTLHHLLAPRTDKGSMEPLDDYALQAAQRFLEASLADEPGIAESLWLLAGVRWLRGDRDGLAEQAAWMNGQEANDPRFLFFGAVCSLAAGDYAAVLERCERLSGATAAAPPALNGDAAAIHWTPERAYLAGLAHLGLRDRPAAVQALEQTAKTKESPSASRARAILGEVHFQGDDFDKAGDWWQSLDPKQRTAWKLGESLAGTMFLAALKAYQEGRFEEAAEKLRAAGRLGCRDRRLGALLVTALFRAGQTTVYGAQV